MGKKLLILVLLISLKVGAQSSTFSRIDSLVEKGRYQLALKNLFEIDTATHLSQYKIGAIYSSIDNHRTAIEYYKASLKFKENYSAKLMLGKSYQKLRKYDKAMRVYEELLQTDDKNLVLAYQLGKLYAVKYKLLEAEKLFKDLIKKDATNANYYYQLGLVYGKMKRGNLMLDYFLKAFNNDHTHIKSIYQLAKNFTRIKKKDSAKIFVNKGLELDSLNLNLNKLKINELFRNKKYRKAITVLTLLDSVAPYQLYTNKMLGRSYFNIDSLDLAEKHFNQALGIDIDDFRILTYLGHISKMKKQYRYAQYHYWSAITRGRKSRHDEFYSLGLLHLELKEAKMAIAMFKASIKESNRYYKVLYQLALTSDSFYKDKKIAYKYYEDYLNRFEIKDKELTTFVKNRMKEIKEELFMKGKLTE